MINEHCPTNKTHIFVNYPKYVIEGLRLRLVSNVKRCLYCNVVKPSEELTPNSNPNGSGKQKKGALMKTLYYKYKGYYFIK